MTERLTDKTINLIKVIKTYWRKAWQPTPVFLTGESHGQRSLESCSPWGHKEGNMTK